MTTMLKVLGVQALIMATIPPVAKRDPYVSQTIQTPTGAMATTQYALGSTERDPGTFSTRNHMIDHSQYLRLTQCPI